MNSLNLLIQNIPPWVKIRQSRKDGAKIVASPPGLGSRTPPDFYLELRPSEHGGVCVLERPEDRQLPEFCLERHINPDSTFCLFFGSETGLNDQEAASYWWSSLGSFLHNQGYAKKHGVWPLAAGLSHGDAAKEQIAMEKLADPLGWKDDLWRAMFRGKGWLAGRLPRVSKDLDRVLNARTSCPRGCTWKHKRLRKTSCEADRCHPDCRRHHKPVLRADCPRRNVVEALVLHEHRRRNIETQIVDELFRAKRQCCGTMRKCQLRTCSGA